jgi:hypothetical protein
VRDVEGKQARWAPVGREARAQRYVSFIETQRLAEYSFFIGDISNKDGWEKADRERDGGITSMATAVFPGPNRPAVVGSRKARSIPSLLEGRQATNPGDLTIHRITETHHGRTLITLGHAAEYLVNSRRYSAEKFDYEAHAEAVHILMGLSRSVFDEAVQPRKLHQRFQDWVVERVVRIVEWGAG